MNQRPRKPLIPAGRPRALVHAAALFDRVTDEQGHPDALARRGIRRGLLSSGLRRRARGTAAPAALGLFLRRFRPTDCHVGPEAVACSAPTRSHPAGHVFLLQRLGSLPGTRGADVRPLRWGGLYARRGEHQRCGPDCAVLVPDRRELPRGAARRLPQSEQRTYPAGIRSDDPLALWSDLDYGRTVTVSQGSTAPSAQWPQWGKSGRGRSRMSASPQRPKADLREKVLRGISRGLAARH